MKFVRVHFRRSGRRDLFLIRQRAAAAWINLCTGEPRSNYQRGHENSPLVLSFYFPPSPIPRVSSPLRACTRILVADTLSPLCSPASGCFLPLLRARTLDHSGFTHRRATRCEFPHAAAFAITQSTPRACISHWILSAALRSAVFGV